MILRPYQTRVERDVLAAFEAGNRIVALVMPTGAGKTVVFADTSKKAAQSGTRTGILVHRDSLLLQAHEKLREFGVDHSIIAPGRRHYGDRVSVASVQTLVRRLDRHRFDFLIIDEGHHAVSPTYRKIIAANPDAHVLLVTATPCRTDGTGLDTVGCEKLVLGPSIQELVADGYLVEPIPYGAARKIDFAGVHSVGGDYDRHELAEITNTRAITGDAVEHYRQTCDGVPAMVFCVDVQHAEDVAAAFCAAGYRFASVDGKMRVEEVRRRLAALKDGGLDGLTSCDLVSEGTDLPRVVCGIMLRKTKSMGLFLQQGGRLLRPVYARGHDLDTREGRLAAIAASEKPKAILLDHVGNTFSFGSLDDDREWSLEGRQKRGKKTLELTDVRVKMCPKCYHIHKPAPACPECQHVYEVAEAEAPRVVDGTLTPIDKEALRRARRREEQDAQTWPELRELGKRRGYAPQWAWREFLKRGGDPAEAR